MLHWEPAGHAQEKPHPLGISENGAHQATSTQVRQLHAPHANLAGGPEGSGKLGRLVSARLFKGRPGELREDTGSWLGISVPACGELLWAKICHWCFPREEEGARQRLHRSVSPRSP